MKMRNVLILAASLVLAAFLVSCAPQTISVGAIIDKIDDHLKTELQLTADQSAKLADFTNTIKKSLAEGTEAGKARNAEWIAMIESPQLDQAKIREMAKAHSADMAKNTDAWLDLYLPKMAAFHDSLTAAQLKKASAFFQKMMTRITP